MFIPLYTGSANDLRTLQDQSEVINTKQLEDVFKNVESNTKVNFNIINSTSIS
jgi:hypothetical protein